jgi:predicted dehydrogenase
MSETREALRVGVVGCGIAGGWHAGALLQLGHVEVRGLVDIEPEKIRRLGARLPALAEVPAFGTFEEMCDAVELDGVVIATPHRDHHPLLMAAIGQGLHVLCEKPMVVTPEQAREVEATATQAGVIVTIDYQRRMEPGYQYARDAIARGELGEVRMVEATIGQGWARLTRDSWRQDPELSGGGMLMDTGSHMVDVLLWLVGRRATTVTALVDNRGTAVDIDTAAVIAFEDGIQGQLTALGDLQLAHVERVVVSGTEGMLVYECDPQRPWQAGRVRHFRDGSFVQPLELGGWGDLPAAWVEATARHTENPVPPAAGVRVAELTHAIYQSAERAARVAV